MSFSHIFRAWICFSPSAVSLKAPSQSNKAHQRFGSASPRRIIFLFTGIAFVLVLLLPARTNQSSAVANVHSLSAFQPTRAYLPEDSKKKVPDPIRWLEQNSDNEYAVSKGIHMPSLGWNRRPRAALISLVRNSELEGMMQSMRQLEFRWNRKYQVCGNIISWRESLIFGSTRGSSSMTSRSLRNSKLRRGILLPRSAIMRLFRRTIGHFLTGLMREDL